MATQVFTMHTSKRCDTHVDLKHKRTTYKPQCVHMHRTHTMYIHIFIEFMYISSPWEGLM